MEEVIKGTDDVSDDELEKLASKLCKQDVKIDKSYTVGHSNVVQQENILAVFVKKQSGVGAVEILPYNSIRTGPGEKGWAILPIVERCTLFGQPLVRFFR
ncbi:hypothetical protein AOQ84DRAFT_354100 [Glonium stellatum]|uniref:Uncharacterized protein n=1 Tax=Glonium stellatum TaxID=574774 RepID=A0A8E2JTP0_9PEZI|nr:hypothetical protein AOQ84DRAFT_354100 [Glonium stellatum]